LDPAEGIWSAAPSLATARAAHTATLLSNGKLLLVGGFSTSAQPRLPKFTGRAQFV